MPRQAWVGMGNRIKVKRSLGSGRLTLEERSEGPQPLPHNRTEDGRLSSLLDPLFPASRLASCHPGSHGQERESS